MTGRTAVTHGREPEVVVHGDADALAEAAADQLVAHLAMRQREHGSASVALTGGGVGTAVLAAVAASGRRDDVDWSRLDVWWGDERFVPAGDRERNETGAREALLDHVPLDPARTHPMPASDGPDGNDAQAAARRYSEELSAAAPGGGVPALDLVLLGVGPDGHVASLFPGHPSLAGEGLVVAVPDAPKPPPTRLSLTPACLNAAREVWFLVAGAEKSEAVERALAGGDPVQTPAAGVRGRDRTRCLLDEAAASRLPGHCHR